MAILDRRLIPLIEMLTELGIDWLAFELMEVIRLGREPVEGEDQLALARQVARHGKAETFKSVTFEGDPEDSVLAEPLLGDGQLEWAARYVGERIEAVLAEMFASIGALDDIVASGRDRSAKDGEASTVLVLLDAEADQPVGVTQIEEAQAHVAQLRRSLASWLASVRPDLDR